MRKTVKLLTTIIVVAFTLHGCGLKQYQAIYNVKLDKVEVPKDRTEKFSERDIKVTKENNIEKYIYEDNFVRIDWLIMTNQLNFFLTNKTDKTMRIEWDELSYVDKDNIASGVIHNGVKFTDANSIKQAATSVPPNTSLNETLIPKNNIKWGTMSTGLTIHNGWQQHSLIPSFYNSKSLYHEQAHTFVGERLKVLFPIYIEDVKNDYIFEFEVDHLVNPIK